MELMKLGVELLKGIWLWLTYLIPMPAIDNIKIPLLLIGLAVGILLAAIGMLFHRRIR